MLIKVVLGLVNRLVILAVPIPTKYLLITVFSGV